MYILERRLVAVAIVTFLLISEFRPGLLIRETTDPDRDASSPSESTIPGAFPTFNQVIAGVEERINREEIAGFLDPVDPEDRRGERGHFFPT
ncbi:MAG: hypothetical protein NVSMB9_17550 [Isosphaeraceae bacterium]